MSDNHPDISASKAHRLARCPRSFSLSKDAPPEPESADANEGKTLHAIRAGGQPPKKITDEQKWAVEWCRREEKELILSTFKGLAPIIMREEFLEGIIPGTPDLIAMSHEIALVTDDKYGRDPVDPAESNLQMRCYAVDVADAFGVQGVITQIFQPRIAAELRSTPCMYGPKDLEVAREEMREIVRRCHEPDAPICAGKWCRYCPAKLTCPALDTWSHAMEKISLGDIEPTKAREYWEKAHVVEWQINAIKSRIYQMVQNAESENRKIPGLHLEAGDARRNVTDLSKAFNALGLQESVFLGACKAKIGELETAYKEAKGLKGKGAKDAFNEALTEAGALAFSSPDPSLELDK